jgi:cytochrome P450
VDPSEHDLDRRRMMRHFGPPECPHMIAGMEPEIRRIFTGLLDDMKGKTRIDVVDEFAFPGPVTVICKVLGVPLEAELTDYRNSRGSDEREVLRKSLAAGRCYSR